MSKSMHVRLAPTAPTDLSDLLGETGVVEQLVWASLFGEREAFVTPEEALTSHDGGLTGGQLLHACGSSRHYLDGALKALELHEGSTLPATELRAFLAGLDRHGPLLITLEH